MAYGARLESGLGASPRGFKSRILRGPDKGKRPSRRLRREGRSCEWSHLWSHLWSNREVAPRSVFAQFSQESPPYSNTWDWPRPPGEQVFEVRSWPHGSRNRPAAPVDVCGRRTTTKSSVQTDSTLSIAVAPKARPALGRSRRVRSVLWLWIVPDEFAESVCDAVANGVGDVLVDAGHLPGGPAHLVDDGPLGDTEQ